MAEFGSFANGTPATYSGSTITPAIVQGLSNYGSGWFSAIVGANSPCIEDWNALCYLFAYQLSYIMQLGVAEWDSGTTYYVGSIVQDGNGNLFVSLTNTNLNNALTSAANWRPFAQGTNLVAINPATQSPYTMSSADDGRVFLVNSANGAMTFDLPNPASMPIGFSFSIKDAGFSASGGGFGVNACTLVRHATENIDNVAASYVMSGSGGNWKFSTDLTNWWIV